MTFVSTANAKDTLNLFMANRILFVMVKIIHVCHNKNQKLNYSKTCIKRPLLKRQKMGFQDQLSLNAAQKYYIMLKGEHFAILSTFIKLPFVIKIFVLSAFE